MLVSTGCKTSLGKLQGPTSLMSLKSACSCRYSRCVEQGANNGAAMGLGECRMNTNIEDFSRPCRSSFLRPPSAVIHMHI